MRKKVTFLHQGMGPPVSEKFELLYGPLDPDEFVQVPMSEADYLFFTPFTPDHHAVGPDTIKIFIAGENTCPDLNACDYAVCGEFMELGDRVLRVPVYAMDPQATDLAVRPRVTAEDLVRKERFCNFIYSNAAVADPFRSEFYHALNAAKQVTSAGQLFRNYFNLSDALPGSDWSAAKRKFLEECRFTISIENSQHPGYITEKVTDPLLSNSIPIYWGDPNIAAEINPECLVHVRDYDTIDEAIRAILALDQAPDKQLTMQNAPVFTGGVDRVAAYKSAARDFFDAIFDQPITTARRRPRHGWLQVIETWRRRDQTGFKKRFKRNRF